MEAMKDKFYTAPVAAKDDSTGDFFDVDKLSTQLQVILTREIKNLLSESSNKKLSPGSARDLVVYLELMETFKKKRQKSLEEMPESELQKILKDDK